MSKETRLDLHQPRTRVIVRVNGKLVAPPAQELLTEIVQSLDAIVAEMQACNPRNYPIKAETLERWSQNLARAGEAVTSISNAEIE